MTIEAPLSLARSEGRGSNASGSAAGGMMVSICARSPATACAMLARSLVVATTRMLAAAVRATSERPNTHKRASTMRGLHRPRASRLRSELSGRSPFRNENALREQAVHVLLGVRDCADPAIHRDAGEAIGIEARDLLFAFEPFDHAHRSRVHRLVQIRIRGVGDVVFRRLLGRTLHILATGPVLGIEAVNALLDVDHLRYAAIRHGRHQLRRLIS